METPICFTRMVSVNYSSLTRTVPFNNYLLIGTILTSKFLALDQTQTFTMFVWSADPNVKDFGKSDNRGLSKDYTNFCVFYLSQVFY